MSTDAPIAGTLEAEIERLYSAFAKYRPTHLAVRSPYIGVSEAQVAKLQSSRLRELNLDDLELYIRSALTVWADVPELKYFLPRICELIVSRPSSIDPLVFEKLDAAEWRTWPKAEQVAVEAYITALWRWLLTLSPDVVDAGDFLRGFGFANYDLTPCLAAWRNDPSLVATEQLAWFVLGLSSDLQCGIVPEHWNPKDWHIIFSFLMEPDTRARIETAFLEHSEGDAGQRLASASDILSRLIQ
jgi:hypothetical protein